MMHLQYRASMRQAAPLLVHATGCTSSICIHSSGCTSRTSHPCVRLHLEHRASMQQAAPPAPRTMCPAAPPAPRIHSSGCTSSTAHPCVMRHLQHRASMRQATTFAIHGTVISFPHARSYTDESLNMQDILKKRRCVNKLSSL